MFYNPSSPTCIPLYFYSKVCKQINNLPNFFFFYFLTFCYFSKNYLTAAAKLHHILMLSLRLNKKTVFSIFFFLILMSKVIFLEKKVWGRKTVLLLSNISWERYGITICYFFLYIFVINYIKKQHNFMLPWSVSLMSGIGNCYILVVIFYDFPLPSIPTLCCCFWHYIISVRLLLLVWIWSLFGVLGFPLHIIHLFLWKWNRILTTQRAAMKSSEKFVFKSR